MVTVLPHCEVCVFLISAISVYSMHSLLRNSPVSGRALPIRVAKNPRMLVATRDSPSRLRLPPGPCCPGSPRCRCPGAQYVMFSSLPILVCVHFPDAARAGGETRGLRIGRGGVDGDMRRGAAAADWTPSVT